ncbi:MAG: hypothetical protein AABY27_04420 [Pseudomonadota bacterium]
MTFSNTIIKLSSRLILLASLILIGIEVFTFNSNISRPLRLSSKNFTRVEDYIKDQD